MRSTVGRAPRGPRARPGRRRGRSGRPPSGRRARPRARRRRRRTSSTWSPAGEVPYALRAPVPARRRTATSGPGLRTGPTEHRSMPMTTQAADVRRRCACSAAWLTRRVSRSSVTSPFASTGSWTSLHTSGLRSRPFPATSPASRTAALSPHGPRAVPRSTHSLARSCSTCSRPPSKGAALERGRRGRHPGPAVHLPQRGPARRARPQRVARLGLGRPARGSGDRRCRAQGGPGRVARAGPAGAVHGGEGDGDASPCSTGCDGCWDPWPTRRRRS